MRRRCLPILLRGGPVALLLALLTGCTAAREPNAIPPQELRHNPRLAEGQHAFMQYCNQCHPGGAGGVGASLADKPIPPFVLRLKVRHSIGAMPSISSDILSDAQLDDVITYLRYLRQHAGELEG
jgi:mono/diheme cytochrome c family protein